MSFRRLFPILALLLTTVSSCTTKEGVTPLMFAAKDGDNRELKRLLAEGVEIDQLSQYKWTALIFAASRGNRQAVELLLEAGADANAVSASIPPKFMASRGGYPSTTPLREAIRENHTDIAELLLDHGATLEKGAIALCGRVEDPTFLASLRRRGVDFRLAENYRAPLYDAAGKGNLNTLRWLIQHGAEPNTSTGLRSVLAEAVYYSEVECVRYLLQQGADPNLEFSEPRIRSTALTTAVKVPYVTGEEKNLAIIRLLLKYGADKSFRDGLEGHTPLESTVQRRDSAQQRLASISEEHVRKRLRETIEGYNNVIRVLQ